MNLYRTEIDTIFWYFNCRLMMRVMGSMPLIVLLIKLSIFIAFYQFSWIRILLPLDGGSKAWIPLSRKHAATDLSCTTLKC
ncbi:hypothetical protein AK821_10415 [Pseudomonas sp. RIT-PI-r]|nr:hypothetical protein AK821_10415 [Pseudomonas sp. RIT-PI-r]